jgi:hypothetical protein
MLLLQRLVIDLAEIAKPATSREFDKFSNEPATEKAKEWRGWGTALKPAQEPICLARKPLSEPTIAANVLKWGTGALNIDGCRIETEESLNGGAYAKNSIGRHDGDESWRFKNGRSSLPGDERTGAAAGMFQPGKTAEREFKPKLIGDQFIVLTSHVFSFDV